MANTQNTINIYESYLDSSSGVPRTAQDLANMKAAIQNDSSLDASDKAQLLQDLAALEPLVGANGSYQSPTVVGAGNVRSQVVASATPAPSVKTSVESGLVVGEAEPQASTLTTNSATGSKMLSLMQQDPDVLTSLKQYVKSQASQSLLDSVLNALNTTGSYGSQSQQNGSTQPQAKVQASSVVSGQNSSSDDGLTFIPGSVSADDTTAIPTVTSGLSLTTGGAQSGAGNTASLDGWDSNLGLTNPGNIDEFLMMVLLASYEDGQKGLEMMAQNLQKTNNQKKALRSQLAGLYDQKTGNDNADTSVDAQIENVQGQLSSASDDAQMQQLQLQNATQNQQELLQEISSFSKDLYDASMNILRKIGS